MRSILMVLPFVVMTFLCWGNYGPLMHEGQNEMGKSSLRPFICVGLAYFLIAVVAPLFALNTKGEKGHWTISGAIWSLVAGAVGALGALGVVLAFRAHGNPVYVMPLIFGSAPVVNTFVTMIMNRSYKEAGTIFYVGVLVVALGGAGVLVFKPKAQHIQVDDSDPEEVKITKKSTVGGKETTWTVPGLDALMEDDQYAEARGLYMKYKGPSFKEWFYVLGAICLTGLCWGSYGPTLHKGQMKMGGSRMRPFMCVGLSYFLIAVLAPLVLLGAVGEGGSWSLPGAFWSLGAGAAGAFGALGIILAFNFGGKPIFVMPLVFGGAPVINTLTTVISEGTADQIKGPFYLMLVMVIAGAVTVLLFAPRAQHGPPKEVAKPTGNEPTDENPLDVAAGGPSADKPNKAARLFSKGRSGESR